MTLRCAGQKLTAYLRTTTQPAMSLQHPAMDPYRILSVQRTSALEVIREAYLALAWRHHPDHGGSPERMVAINSAWDEIRGERTHGERH